MDYMIADSDKKRCSLLQKRIDIYRSANCLGSFAKEVELLEKTWLQQPELVLVYAGDQRLNAYSVLKRIKEVTPEVKVVFYSEHSDYAMDAYDKGADYFLPLPVDDIQIGKLVFRYIGKS
jgi:two-component SAPR family response regulator